MSHIRISRLFVVCIMMCVAGSLYCGRGTASGNAWGGVMYVNMTLDDYGVSYCAQSPGYYGPDVYTTFMRLSISLTLGCGVDVVTVGYSLSPNFTVVLADTAEHCNQTRQKVPTLSSLLPSNISESCRSATNATFLGYSVDFVMTSNFTGDRGLTLSARSGFDPRPTSVGYFGADAVASTGACDAVLALLNTTSPPATAVPSTTPVPQCLTSSLDLLNPLVFNYTEYLTFNPDLVQSGISNELTATNHWLNYGASSGRQGSARFHSWYYLKTNKDISSAYGSTNYIGSILHYIIFGYKEPRIATALASINADKYLSPYVFQYGYYAARYPKLSASGVLNEATAKRHWILNGIEEGRRASLELDPPYYLYSNWDLNATFGAGNFGEAIVHYVTFGRGEGRRGSA